MPHILAVTNQKGGVGKTTTSVNLAASLAATRRSVLLVDLDPQGNATMGSGIDKRHLALSTYEVLIAKAPLVDAVQRSSSGKYDLLPANGDLTAAELELFELPAKERRLQQALATVQGRYEYVIIDCPPSLSMLTVNAMVAADGVIVPVQCEYYALEGLTALMETLNGIRQKLNPILHIEGILRTMYDPRSRLAKDVSEELNNYFGDKVFRTCIPRNVRLAEAPSYGEPVLSYDKTSKGAMAYLALAGELLRRLEASENVTQKVS